MCLQLIKKNTIFYAKQKRGRDAIGLDSTGRFSVPNFWSQ